MQINPSRQAPLSDIVAKIPSAPPAVLEVDSQALPLDHFHVVRHRAQGEFTVLQFSASSPPPARADLQISLQDSNGFLVMGQNDLQATLNGEIILSQDFMLQQLAELNTVDENLRFKPPEFDSERRQYVLNGKAHDVFLGIDVGFEMRVGSHDDQLAFRMDNGLKRGIAYKVLGKQLGKLGLETRKEDRQLLLEPRFAREIEFVMNKETGQTARIESIEADPNNLKIEIDAQGRLKLSLQDLPVTLSSDAAGPTEIRSDGPDSARFDVQIDLDHDLKPVIQIEDGEVQSQNSAEALSPILKAKGSELLSQELGTALSLNISSLQGEVQLDEGLELDLQGHLELDNRDDPEAAHLHSDTQVKLSDEGLELKAQNVELKSLSGQALDAETIAVRKAEGKGLDLEVDVQGLNAEVQQGRLAAEAQDVNLSGSVQRQANGDLEIELEGQAQGRLKPETSSEAAEPGQFASSGRHRLVLNEEKLDIDVEQLTLSGDFELPSQAEDAEETEAEGASDAPENEKDKPSRRIQAQVESLNLDGARLQTQDLEIEAQLQDGRLRAELGPEQKQVRLDGEFQVDAEGARINGSSAVRGAQLTQDDTGLRVQLDDHKTQGAFANAKETLAIEGELQGAADIQIQDGDVHLQTEGGRFDAKVNSNDKIFVEGEGGDLDLRLGLGAAEQRVELTAEDIDLNTELQLKDNQIKTRTQGERAELSLAGQNVEISTHNTQSEIQDIQIKDTIRGSGSTGDVDVQIVAQDDGRQDVRVQAQEADVQAQIRNRRDSMNIDADAQGDIQLDIQEGNKVRIRSENGSTEVDVALRNASTQEDKVRVQASGGDFDVQVEGQDDLEIQLQEGRFEGQITPSEKLAIDVQSSSVAGVNVSLSKVNHVSQIRVSSAAAVEGRLQLDDKLSSRFDSGSGFEVAVDESPEAGEVRTRVQDVQLEGELTVPGVHADFQGQTDVSVRAVKRGPVHLAIEGEVSSQASIANKAEGELQFEGQINVALNKKDLDLEMHGPLQLNARAAQINATGRAYIPTGEEGLQLSVRDKKVNIDLGAEGFIELDNPASLELNKPGVEEFLGRLQSEQVRLYYSNLSLQESGQTASVELRSSAIDSDYGRVQVAVNVNKGEELNMDGGSLEFTPDLYFYELLQQQLSDKYNIDIEGVPSFENGEIRVKGEVRTRPSGLIQLADFNIKATVEDNKLVFELDKAQVMGVVGTNTAGRLLNRVLSKTDIDVFSRSNQKIEITLADIVKDLSLTQGINFSGLRLEDNRFKVDFYFDGLDQKVAQAANGNDLTELKSLLNAHGVMQLSEESLSMAFTALAEHEEVEAAAALMQESVDRYLAAPDAQTRHKYERALHWMAKNKAAIKADIEDNISLLVARELNPQSAQGREKIATLPRAFVEQLADNLDLTFSQSFRFSLISPEERRLANALRRIHGLKENHRPI